MKPFPPAERLSFLLGSELEIVTVGPFQMDIRFAEGSSLVVEHGLEYQDAEGRLYRHDPQRQGGPDPISLHQLIGDRIEAIDASDWRLTLTFASGRKLIVASKPGPYESGHVYHAIYDAETGKLKDVEMIVF
jgi:hypothetical protein